MPRTRPVSFVVCFLSILYSQTRHLLLNQSPFHLPMPACTQHASSLLYCTKTFSCACKTHNSLLSPPLSPLPHTLPIPPRLVFRHHLLLLFLMLPLLLPRILVLFLLYCLWSLSWKSSDMLSPCLSATLTTCLYTRAPVETKLPCQTRKTRAWLLLFR